MKYYMETNDSCISQIDRIRFGDAKIYSMVHTFEVNLNHRTPEEFNRSWGLIHINTIKVFPVGSNTPFAKEHIRQLWAEE